MIRLARLDHIVLRANDAPKLVAFYVSVLGCTVERELDLGLTQLRAGQCLIDIVPVSGQLGQAGGAGPGAEGHNLDHFCFLLETFDEQAILAELARHGISAAPAATRYGAQGYAKSIYIDDPEGNTVELRQLLDVPNFEEPQ